MRRQKMNGMVKRDEMEEMAIKSGHFPQSCSVHRPIIPKKG